MVFKTFLKFSPILEIRDQVWEKLKGTIFNDFAPGKNIEDDHLPPPIDFHLAR